MEAADSESDDSQDQRHQTTEAQEIMAIKLITVHQQQQHHLRAHVADAYRLLETMPQTPFGDAPLKIELALVSVRKALKILDHPLPVTHHPPVYSKGIVVVKHRQPGVKRQPRRPLDRIRAHRDAHKLNRKNS
jgi:hypothetical protein